MKSLVGLQEIKLNSTGTYSSSAPWALHSDTEAYPFLKPTKHLSHISLLPKALTTITLEADNITSLQYFYDGINTAIMAISSFNDFLPDYVDLHQNLDDEDYILPPVDHPQRVDGANIFKNMSKILLHHLKCKGTTNFQNDPDASLAIRENVLSTCGFQTFFAIVTKLSLQLGRYTHDLEIYV